MSLTTAGSISVTPIRIETGASLESLVDAARERPYKGEVPTAGWGSVFVGDEAVGRRGRGGRPAPSAPDLLPEGDFHPQQFRARFLWDQVDKDAIALLGELADDALVHQLQATDITLTETPEEGVLLGLLGLRRRSQIDGHVIPGLRELLLSVDDNTMIYSDSSPIDFGDEDFFHWLLYRAHYDPKVTEAIKLRGVRSISSQDNRRRGAAISEGADLDRPELLALISGNGTKFGPAKVVLSDRQLGLDADMELRLDGGFSIYVGSSEYDVVLPRVEVGLRLVQDVAFKIIPELKSAYESDSRWPKVHRAKFLADSRSQLTAALLPNGCPHCGVAV